MPIIVSLGNKDLTERHWKNLFSKMNFNPASTFSFKDLKKNNVKSHQTFIEETS